MEHFLLWLILGLVLLAAELLSGAFVLIFFGIGGLVTALLAFVFLMAWPVQIIIFAVFSTLLLLAFRKRFLKPSTPEERQRALSPDIDSTVVLSNHVSAGGETSISYQGSPWTAVNLENFDLEAGETVRIERTEGIKLFIRRASTHRSV